MIEKSKSRFPGSINNRAILLLNEQSVGETAAVAKVDVIKSVIIDVGGSESVPASNFDTKKSLNPAYPVIHSMDDLSLLLKGSKHCACGICQTSSSTPKALLMACDFQIQKGRRIILGPLGGPSGINLQP